MISAIIEQNHDELGIIWPEEIAPYQVTILPLDVTDSKIMGSATEMYASLVEEGITVLLDDRDERAGVKFKDADLLGVPYQVILGRESIKKETLELKERKTNKRESFPASDMLKNIKRIVHG